MRRSSVEPPLLDLGGSNCRKKSSSKRTDSNLHQSKKHAELLSQKSSFSLMIVVKRRSNRRALGRDPGSARCVRGFRDSLNPAIHTTYRSLLRSSSMWEPRCPSLRVIVLIIVFFPFPAVVGGRPNPRRWGPPNNREIENS